MIRNFCNPNFPKKFMKVIPILRIFDYVKTIEFYVNWLGFTIDWEHKYGENFPVYMQVSFRHITLHLSEHHGDCVPGARVYIEFSNLKAYHKELINKDYKFNKPGLGTDMCMDVTDPFGNRLSFNEAKS